MGFSFRPPWWGIVLVVVSVSLFCKLGLWQYHRAAEKEQLLNQAKATNSYISLSTSFEIKPFQKLEVSGTYEKQSFLLDNRFYQHQVGFDVLALLKVSDKYLLVDRGWVKATQNRKVLPILKTVQPTFQHKGQAYYPSEKSWVLDNAMPDVEKNIVLLQKVDIPQLSKLLNVELYPFVLRLDRSDPNALVREWQVVTMKPEKHLGYAMQWFSFALIALVIFIMLNLNLERKKHASR